MPEGKKTHIYFLVSFLGITLQMFVFDLVVPLLYIILSYLYIIISHQPCPGQRGLFFVILPQLAQDWNLLRIWDAMEFEEEHNESTRMELDGRGDVCAGQSKDLLQLGVHLQSG